MSKRVHNFSASDGDAGFSLHQRQPKKRKICRENAASPMASLPKDQLMCEVLELEKKKLELQRKKLEVQTRYYEIAAEKMQYELAKMRSMDDLVEDEG